jgi:DNA invertase Pin-like site-specific DNA recombinase
VDELRTGRPLKVAIYTRVSMPDQNPDLQLGELHDYADRQGWEVVGTYHDVISGTKARRPGLDRLMAHARLRNFDSVLVWKLDRFGRSVSFRQACVDQRQ